MDTGAGSIYLETEINTATPQKLRLMLIAGALRHARRTLGLWEEGNFEAALESLIRCRDIVAELLNRLAGQGAAVVVFDVLFAEPDQTSPEPPTAQMSQADPDAGNVNVPGRTSHDAIFARASWDAPTAVADKKTFRGNVSAAYSFAVQAVEVEVDVETGAVRVVDLVAADDVGRPLNPMAVEGQIAGAIAQGTGYAMYEELVRDRGRLLNGNLADYTVPTAASLVTALSLSAMAIGAAYGAIALGVGFTVLGIVVAGLGYALLGLITPELAQRFGVQPVAR